MVFKIWTLINDSWLKVEKVGNGKVRLIANFGRNKRAVAVVSQKELGVALHGRQQATLFTRSNLKSITLTPPLRPANKHTEVSLFFKPSGEIVVSWKKLNEALGG